LAVNGNLNGNDYNALEIALRNGKLDPIKTSVKPDKDSDMLNRLDKAYSGIIWRDLSIDLVAASLRQREFTHRLMNECNAKASIPPMSYPKPFPGIKNSFNS
jgi:hypothetical protein